MNLRTHGGENSFYESFSDLIFATMAIFVLIIIVLLINIRPLQTDVVEINNLELVIAVDGTNSMKTTLDKLRKTVNAVVEAIPLVTSEFYIGLVIYRDKTESLNLTRVYPKNEDSGDSYNLVTTHTAKFKPSPSLVSFEQAIDEALKMFTKEPARKSLMILGDVGPYETGKQINCDADKIEHRIINKMHRFAEANNGLKVYTMFTGEELQLNCKEQTVNFFKQLTAAGSPDSKYTDDPNKLLVMLLQAALGSREEK